MRTLHPVLNDPRGGGALRLVFPSAHGLMEAVCISAECIRRAGGPLISVSLTGPPVMTGSIYSPGLQEGSNHRHPPHPATRSTSTTQHSALRSSSVVAPEPACACVKETLSEGVQARFIM